MTDEVAGGQRRQHEGGLLLRQAVVLTDGRRKDEHWTGAHVAQRLRQMRTAKSASQTRGRRPAFDRKP